MGLGLEVNLSGPAQAWAPHLRSPFQQAIALRPVSRLQGQKSGGELDPQGLLQGSRLFILNTEGPTQILSEPKTLWDPRGMNGTFSLSV